MSVASISGVSPVNAGTPARATRPLVGIAGVLLGAFISTFSGRITTFGLADVRGAIGAGFDEAAWITTASTVGQMVIAFPVVWLGAAFGPRRVLLWAAAIHAVAATAVPLAGDLRGVLFLQAVSGLASGAFIPLAIGFVLRNLRPSLAPYGIAVYGMNSELSQNIAASFEGWFDEHLSWRWIFWDTALIAPLMMVCVWFGIPREPVNRAALGSADVTGMLFGSAGFGMLYAGLDQGNRLDWLNSGLICALLVGGTILVAAFVAHEAIAARPAIHLGFLVHGNIPLIAVLLIVFRLVVLSTAYLIPQFLTTIQGFRALQIGDVLLWIALPQLLLAPIGGTVLRYVDARIPLALGFALIGAACLMASELTAAWSSDDFLPSQVLQAVGQSIGLTSLVFFATRHLVPAEALTFGAFLQTVRLLGGEMGSAFMQTFVRIREQMHSFLLGEHVMAGTALTSDRLSRYAGALATRSLDPGEASARATGILARSVQGQSYVLAYADGFTVLGYAVVACLALMFFLRSAPIPRAAPSVSVPVRSG